MHQCKTVPKDAPKHSGVHYVHTWIREAQPVMQKNEFKQNSSQSEKSSSDKLVSTLLDMAMQLLYYQYCLIIFFKVW